VISVPPIVSAPRGRTNPTWLLMQDPEGSVPSPAAERSAPRNPSWAGWLRTLCAWGDLSPHGQDRGNHDHGLSCDTQRQLYFGRDPNRRSAGLPPTRPGDRAHERVGEGSILAFVIGGVSAASREHQHGSHPSTPDAATSQAPKAGLSAVVRESEPIDGGASPDGPTNPVSAVLMSAGWRRSMKAAITSVLG